MNILDRLWEAYRETAFASFSSALSELDLSHDELTVLIATITDMADNGTVRAGYWVRRVAPTGYKLIQSTQDESTQCEGDSPKGLPLTDDKESLTGQNEEGFSSTDGENEPLERFSFFARGDDSRIAKNSGSIADFINHVRTNTAWKQRIEAIRAIADEDEQKKAKVKLPAVTVSILVTRTDGKREGIKESDFVHTNLIQADFDNHPDPESLLLQLKHDPYVRAVFKSSRGKAKAFIRVAPVESIHGHDSARQAVKDYCQAQGYGEIDDKPKNINALCFISHDPTAALKDAKPLHWSALPEHPAPRPFPSSPTDNQKPSIDAMQSILDYISADDYEIWMTVGCALRREGYDFSLWDAWSQKSAEYGKQPTTPDKMPQKWESFKEEHERKATLGTIYHHAQAHGWQPPHRQIYQPGRQEYRHGYHTNRLMNRKPL